MYVTPEGVVSHCVLFHQLLSIAHHQTSFLVCNCFEYQYSVHAFNPENGIPSLLNRRRSFRQKLFVSRFL